MRMDMNKVAERPAPNLLDGMATVMLTQSKNATREEVARMVWERLKGHAVARERRYDLDACRAAVMRAGEWLP